MAEVVWSEPALGQFEAILEFIAMDKPDAAQAVAIKVFAATDKLSRFPTLGRHIREFPHQSYRQLWIAPCWIYYRTEKKRVIILHVRRGEKLFRAEDLLANGD